MRPFVPDRSDPGADGGDSSELAIDLSTSLTRITSTVRLDELVYVGDYRLIASLGPAAGRSTTAPTCSRLGS